MKNTFSGYYRLSEQELSILWKNCIFIFDANVLLNLYRYPKEARADLLKIMKLISSRVWLPHQAALEYQENRLGVIAEQLKRYDEVRAVLNDIQNKLKGDFGRLQLQRRHSSINPDNLLNQVDILFTDFLSDLALLEKKQPDVFGEDEIRNDIDELFSDKVGRVPIQENLNAIYEEGKKRYELKQPPGYEDRGKAKKDENDSHLYRGMVFKREFGDLVLWKEIIEKAREEQIKNIIFITDDDKQDWWWITESKGSKIIGPHPELIEEIHYEGKVDLFYMYNSERFLEFAKKYLGAKIKQQSIEDVREVKLINRETDSLMQRAMVVERAVYNWIKSLYPLDNLSGSRQFPDLTRISQDGSKVGYEIKMFRDIRMVAMRLEREWSYRAHYIAEQENYSEIKFVFVCENETNTQELARYFKNRKLDVSKISIVVGVLENKADGIPTFKALSEIQP